MDSDDLFYDDFLLEMSQTLDENKADICVANFYMVDIVSNEKSLIISKKKKGITDKVFNVRELGKDALDYWMPVPWNKMFRKSFLVDKKIEFQNLRNCNDTYFGFSSVIKADGIIFCRKEYPLISYRVNNSKQISYEMDPRNMMKAYGRLFEENEDDAVIIEMLINELKISIEPMISRCSNKQFNNECREMAQKLTGKYQQKVATK